MGYYKNNKDGTLSSIATNVHLLDGQSDFVTQAELLAGLATKQNIITVNTTDVINESIDSYTKTRDVDFSYTNNNNRAEVIQIFAELYWYADDADTDTPIIDIMDVASINPYVTYPIYLGTFDKVSEHIGSSDAFYECHGSTIVLPQGNTLGMAILCDFIATNAPNIKYTLRATKILEIN